MCMGRKGDVGNMAEKGKGDFLSWKTRWSIEYCELEDVYLKRKSWLFLFFLYNWSWGGRHKLFIHVDICFLSLPVQKKVEKGKKIMILERCKSCLCNISITISVSFFSRYYSSHPCFLLYCSISECCCLVYGLDMCERRRCDSQYRKMLYFCYEIY